MNDTKRRQTDTFSCGWPTLDLWLRAYASQGQRRDASRTFVVTDDAGAVAGYYTLAMRVSASRSNATAG